MTRADLTIVAPTPPPPPAGGSPAPEPGGFVLVLAGGGYVARAEHEYLDVTAWLSRHGVASGYLDYPVAPATYPAALTEVLRALADLRAGVHGPVAGPVAVLGFSAGGHLAGLALTATDAEVASALGPGTDPAEARPDAAVLCYPVVSMSDLPHLGSRANLLGADADSTDVAKRLSVERRVDARTAPTFLWHTADDAVVDVEHSLRLAQALSRAQVPLELHVYPSGEHGLGLAEQAGAPTGWTHACLRWLAEQGIGPAAPTETRTP